MVLPQGHRRNLGRLMGSRRLRKGVFVVEGLNSFSTTLFLYYFYFFTQIRCGYGNKANLMIAAAAGLICVPAAVGGGRLHSVRVTSWHSNSVSAL